jgi:hypothetical protein
MIRPMMKLPSPADQQWRILRPLQGWIQGKAEMFLTGYRVHASLYPVECSFSLPDSAVDHGEKKALWSFLLLPVRGLHITPASVGQILGRR